MAFVTSGLSIKTCPPCRDGLPPIYELRSRGQLMRRATWDGVLGLARQQAGDDDLVPHVTQTPRGEVGSALPHDHIPSEGQPL